MKSNINGFRELEKQLESIEKKVKKYDGKHEVNLSYSKEEWNKMSEEEKNNAIEKAQNKFVEDMMSDLFD